VKKLIYLNLILTLIIISVWFFRDTPFGAAILSTSSTDTLSTFRTNVNTSLSNVAAELYLSKSGVTLSPTSTSYFLGVGTSSVAFPLTVQGGIYTASSSILMRSDSGNCYYLIAPGGGGSPTLATSTSCY